MAVDWAGFAATIQQYQKILLVSHIRPDCDALGSELGMAHILESLGKDVRIVNGQATPPNLAFVDPENRIQAIGEDVQPEELDDIELIIILDTSAWAQLGKMGDVIRASTAKKIVVDHHVSEDQLDAEPFKDTQSEATGRLVLEAAEHMGVTLTPEISKPLFAAIATDTGWFRFGSVSSSTYQAAARLVAAGAKPCEIYADLYEQDTLGRIRLRGIMLTRVETEFDGALVHSYVLQEDFASSGAVPSDTEDMINLTLAIAGTQVAVIVIQQQTGGCKISFRSRGKVDCAQVAEQFGGGGHKAAAGAFLEDAPEVARQKVLDVVRAAMR